LNIEVATAADLPGDLVALGVPVFSHDDGPQVAVDPERLSAAVTVPTRLDPNWCTRHGFSGKVGQTVALNASASAEGPGTDVILVGVGEAGAVAGDRGLESLRRASAAFVRAVGQGGTAALVLPATTDLSADRMGAAVAEGGALAAYRYDAFRTGEDQGRLGTLAVVDGADGADGVDGADGADGAQFAAGVARGTRLAESVALARDLVNEPPSSLTPQKFADVFVGRFADRAELAVEVWDEDRIVAERLGGLLGVARGSTQPPRFVRVDYRPVDPIEFGGRVPTWPSSAKGSPSTPVACRSRRLAGWRP